MADQILGIAPQKKTHAEWVSENPTLGKDVSTDSFGQIIISTGSPFGDIMVWGNAQTYNVAYAAGQYYTIGGQSSIIDIVYPVGSQYVQYASVANNDASIALPSAESPSVLFGGTWTKLWDTESLYFRTEGTDADDGRVDGKQLDQFQGHAFNIYDMEGGGGTFRNYTVSGAPQTKTGSGIETDLQANEIISDGTNGTPRTGSETRVTGRLMRIWKRTA